jgi:tetratricopeptide (TPR) repeat protein
MNSTKPILLLTLLILVAPSVRAADALRGAQAVLADVAAQTGAPAQPAAKPPSELARLRADLTNFTARAVTLAPAAAAREWLALGDRYFKLPARQQFGMNAAAERPLQPQELIAALPPPAAWDELAKAIAARPAPAALKDAREFGLRMLGETLRGNRTAVAAELAKFEALLVAAKRQEAQMFLHSVRAVDDALLALSEDPKALVAGVERQLDALERERERGYGWLNLPDLVAVLGEAEATPLVRRAVRSKARTVRIEGRATRALARKLALAEVNELQLARWDLVDSLDAVELYEALDKKFTKPKPAAPAGKAAKLADLEPDEDDFGSDKSEAQTHYLMGLIARGRAADAAKFARTLGGEGEAHISVGEDALARAGFMRELDNFFHALLTESPDLPFWPTYFQAAARTGRTDRMLALARAAAARPDLDAARRGNIRENLYRALLAADEVDEGVKELRALVASSQPAAPGRNPRRMVFNPEAGQHGMMLARLGRLLEKPEWVTEGLAAMQPKAAAGPEVEIMGDYQGRARVELLGQLGRVAEAEQLLTAQLVKAVKQAASQRNAYYGGMNRGPGFEALKGLVELYHRAGRHADVLILLESAPHWGAKDLAELVAARWSGADFDFESFADGGKKGKKANRVALAAAAALLDAGRRAEARAIVDVLLLAAPGDDRCYELLLKLTTRDEAMVQLDTLFARDQFEERPLIWKALLLHQAGRHEEAEKIAKQGIAIDPSDGEQGKGDRMRVYAVLADIRAARGDAKEAEFFRGVIRAIRLSERADDFYAAGLLRRGVKMYQESLTHFADAYCIQSRLAVQLAELGLEAEAAKHYEKAFELMPDSFGRVESHCFGCEGAFTGAQAQNVAERVFTRLAAANPNKPQVHYLLGYLRQQQQRHKDALPHLRRAVQLDPDYLNAWEHLEQAGQEQRLPAAERDAIAFNILRLDPLGRHASASLQSVGDLRGLWNAVAATAKFRVTPPAALLALPASRAELEKKQAAQANQGVHFGGMTTEYHYGGAGAPATPGAAVAQHQLVQAIGGLLNAGGMFVGE